MILNCKPATHIMYRKINECVNSINHLRNAFFPAVPYLSLSVMIFTVFSSFAAWVKQNISVSIDFTIRPYRRWYWWIDELWRKLQKFSTWFRVKRLYWIQLIGNENVTIRIKWWCFFLSSLSIITSGFVICNADWIRDRKKTQPITKERHTHTHFI